MINYEKNEVHVIFEAASLFLELAADFTERAIAAVETKNEFVVLFSGGNTPKPFLEHLTMTQKTTKKIPWEKIKFFFADERYVPSDNAESNFHMLYEYLFKKVPVLEKNVHRIPTEYSDPKEAAVAYEQTLREAFNLKTTKELPLFDIVYLGLGEDAHTASLFPNNEVVINYIHFLQNRSKETTPADFPMVCSLWAASQEMYRITLTPPIINHAENIIFIVTGANKAAAVCHVLEGPYNPKQYPAQLIQKEHNKIIWYLDGTAASELNKK